MFSWLYGSIVTPVNRRMDAFGWLLHNKFKYLNGTAEWFFMCRWLCGLKDGLVVGLPGSRMAEWLDCWIAGWLNSSIAG